MFVQIFGGLLFIAGIVMIIKTEGFLAAFGRISWAEIHFGGGSRFFYKLLGIIFIIVGLLMIFGMFRGIIMWVFSPLLPR